jgi:hypothetical protein
MCKLLFTTATTNEARLQLFHTKMTLQIALRIIANGHLLDNAKAIDRCFIDDEATHELAYA